MSSLSAKRLRFWLPAVLIVLADFVTKRWAEAALVPMYRPHEVIGEYVRFTLAYNPGAAFGIHAGPLSRIIFGALAVLVLVFLGQLYRQTPPADRVRVLALGLVCGGAVGNLIDRIISPRGVVDFIDIGVGTVRFWTFNVADSAVTVGAILLAWSLWREPAPAPDGA